MTHVSDSFGLLAFTQEVYERAAEIEAHEGGRGFNCRDLDTHDEIHDLWGNRGEPKDLHGEREER